MLPSTAVPCIRESGMRRKKRHGQPRCEFTRRSARIARWPICKSWSPPPKNFGRRTAPKLLAFPTPAVFDFTPALAVIDGTLCQLTREGARAGGHAPLATAVVEFRQGPFRVYVREHPYGLLPGIPNLYCLDGALRLQWMAEWHDASDPCVKIVREDHETLLVEAASGALIRLDSHTGRLLGVTQSMAAAS